MGVEIVTRVSWRAPVLRPNGDNIDLIASMILGINRGKRKRGQERANE
jgi:hypothetical protein